MIPNETQLDTKPGFGTQPRYEAPVTFESILESNTVITIMLIKLFPQQKRKNGHGAAK